MVFSRATGYGIRALAYMARQTNLRLCGLNEIAESERIPPVYLRKLLGELRRHRYIESVKGIHGGYIFAKSPQKITLWDVFKTLDPKPHLDECAICHSSSRKPACPFCNEWKRIGEDLTVVLKKKTIAEFALSSKLF